MRKIILGLCHVVRTWGTRGENVGLGKGWSFRKRREGLCPQAAPEGCRRHAMLCTHSEAGGAIIHDWL